MYFACQKIEASYTYRLGEEYSTKWSLIRYITSNTLQYYRIHLAHYSYRYEQDPQGKEKVSIIYPEIDDVFGLKLHSCDIDKDFLCLTAAIPDGFILFFNPLLGDHTQLDRQVQFIKKNPNFFLIFYLIFF